MYFPNDDEEKERRGERRNRFRKCKGLRAVRFISHDDLIYWKQHNSLRINLTPRSWVFKKNGDRSWRENKPLNGRHVIPLYAFIWQPPAVEFLHKEMFTHKNGWSYVIEIKRDGEADEIFHSNLYPFCVFVQFRDYYLPSIRVPKQ